MKFEDRIVVHEFEKTLRAQIANPTMILRGLKFLRAPVITPFSISGITPSETNSL